MLAASATVLLSHAREMVRTSSVPMLAASATVLLSHAREMVRTTSVPMLAASATVLLSNARDTVYSEQVGLDRNKSSRFRQHGVESEPHPLGLPAQVSALYGLQTPRELAPRFAWASSSVNRFRTPSLTTLT